MAEVRYLPYRRKGYRFLHAPVIMHVIPWPQAPPFRARCDYVLGGVPASALLPEPDPNFVLCQRCRPRP